MLNCVFYSLFFVLFLNFSVGSLRLSQVNRAFISSYKGIYEASVITVDENGEPIFPYYSQGLLKKYVQDFVEENIKRYTKNYTLTLNFYKEDGFTPCSPTDLSRNVKIRLDAKINYLFNYSKTQSFSIKERGLL